MMKADRNVETELQSAPKAEGSSKDKNKSKKFKSEDIENKIRLSKISKANKQKKELEEKIKFLTQSIESLNTITEFPAKPKLNLQQSEIRHHFFEEETQKAKKIKEKVKQYSQYQKTRKEKLEKELRINFQAIEDEKQREKIEEQKRIQEKIKAYKENLEKIHIKAEARKQYLDQKKSYSFKHLANQKPLFIQLSERYLTQVEMPELQKRKKELNEKRMSHCYSTKNIMDHARWYESIKKERSNKLSQRREIVSDDRRGKKTERISVWHSLLIKEENEEREARLKKEEDFLRRINKRAQYASLVKQLYSPSLSKGINEETPKKMKIKANSAEIKELVQWKPHKFKPNPFIPASPIRNIKEVKDYLKEFRSARENKEEECKNEEHSRVAEILLTEVPQVKALKEATEKIDKEIKKKELFISCSPKSSLRLSQEVNDMYLSSIKAKLSFLEQF